MSHTITRQRSFSPTSVSPHHSPNSKDERRTKKSVIEDVNKILSVSKASKISSKWCIIHIIMSVLFYFEIFQAMMSFCFLWKHYVFRYIDLVLLCVFIWNALTNLYFYCLPTFIQNRMPLNDNQKKLLGISKENEKFFSKIASKVTTASSPVMKSPSPPIFPSRRTSSRTTPTSVAGGYNFSQGSSPSHQSPSYSYQPYSMNGRQRYSPQRISTPSFSSNKFSSSSGSPPTQYSPRKEDSPYMINQQNISFTKTPSPSVFMNNSRGQSPSLRLSFTSPSKVCDSSQEEQIIDHETLDKFIKKEEEQQLRQRSFQDSPKNTSFWSLTGSAYDYMPVFGNYQLATKSRTPNQKDDETSMMESPFKQEEMWRSFGFKRADIDTWTENIRKWLSETVLEPLVKEIEDVNNQLVKLGHSELQIGTVSHSSLQSVATSKSQQLPSLNVLLPYLDITSNQEYLVQRLKDLSNGGCLRLYRSVSGGLYKTKAWTSDLPTDAQIMCHLFCTYMDTHLPSNPRYNGGKCFTGLHFLKSPDKPDNKKSPFCIYQSNVQKPHFKVLVEDNIYDLPKCRNNLFHSIVVFLYYIKKNNHGMLERVNLGMSGINILWVIEKK